MITPDTTVEQAFAPAMATSNLTAETVHRYRQAAVTQIFPLIGNLPVTAVTSDLMETIYYDPTVDNTALRALNHILVTAKNAGAIPTLPYRINFGNREQQLDPADPTGKIKGPPVEENYPFITTQLAMLIQHMTTATKLLKNRNYTA